MSILPSVSRLWKRTKKTHKKEDEKPTFKKELPKLVMSSAPNEMKTGKTKNIKEAEYWKKELVNQGYLKVRIESTYDETDKWPGQGTTYYNVRVDPWKVRE